MNVRFELKGRTPLLMHNPRMVDPFFEINRKIKSITSKRKKTDEDLKIIEQLEWYGGLYDEEGVIVQPTSKIRKCIIQAGKISKYGKAIERALTFCEMNVPLIYSGPKNIDQVYADSRFHSRLSVGVGNKRVMRMRPKFLPWMLVADGLFVEDAGINFDELQKVVELAGVVEGIGDNRVNNYGRFDGKVVAL